jgi:hypothetical protein
MLMKNKTIAFRTVQKPTHCAICDGHIGFKMPCVRVTLWHASKSICVICAVPLLQDIATRASESARYRAHLLSLDS